MAGADDATRSSGREGKEDREGGDNEDRDRVLEEENEEESKGESEDDQEKKRT